MWRHNNFIFWCVVGNYQIYKQYKFQWDLDHIWKSRKNRGGPLINDPSKEKDWIDRITRQYHRDKVISTSEYLSKIANIYRFIPKFKPDRDTSSSEEESTETASTLTPSVSTRTAIDEASTAVGLNSENDADLTPFTHKYSKIQL